MDFEKNKNVEVTPFDQEIAFECVAAGKPLKATVLGMIDHPLHFSYRVLFSDGFQDDYTIDEQGTVSSESYDTIYLAAVGQDLKCLIGAGLSSKIYILKYSVNSCPVNVWAISSDFPKPNFKITYNGRTRFLMLRKQNRWVEKSFDNQTHFEDKILIKRVQDMLNYYSSEL